MKKEDLINAIGLIDDDLIAEADKLRNKKKRPPIYRITAIAACLCCFISCATVMYINSLNSKDSNDASIQHGASTDIQNSFNSTIGESFKENSNDGAAPSLKPDLENDMEQEVPLPDMKDEVCGGEEPESTPDERPDIKVAVDKITQDGFYATVINIGTASENLFQTGDSVRVVFDGKFSLSKPVSYGKWDVSFVEFSKDIFKFNDVLLVQFTSCYKDSEGKTVIHSDHVIFI